LGIAAVGLIVVQATLGGITVLYNLPVWVSATHLGVSMLFFSLLVHLTTRLRPQVETPTQAFSPSVRTGVGVAALLLYVQIVLGAVVRLTGAGFACAHELPFCSGGSLWPAGFYTRLQMTHRYFAFVVMGVLVAVTVRAMKAGRLAGLRRVRRLAAAAHGLIVLQITLGALTVYFSDAMGPGHDAWIHVVTAHLGIAALLLADLVALYTLLWRAQKDPQVQTSPVSKPVAPPIGDTVGAGA
jgi:heme A synthase